MIRFIIKIVAVMAIFFLMALSVTFSPSIGWIIYERHIVRDNVDINNIGNVADSAVEEEFSLGPFSLTLDTNGTGSGTIDTNTGSPFYYGDDVTIWANASIGSTFTGFYGDLTDITTSQVLTMYYNSTVTAEFVLNSSYNLTLDTNSTGFGTIDDNNSGSFYYGDDLDIYDSDNLASDDVENWSVVVDDSEEDNRFDENKVDDKIDTFIRNSNSNYWTATSSNLQTALNYGGEVTIPSNTIINCSSDIVLNCDGTVLRGHGNSSIIRIEDGTDHSIIVINANNIVIENLQLDGNKGDAAVGDSRVGIAVNDYITNITIRNCFIHNYAHTGILIYDYAEYVLVENCYIEDARIIPGQYGAGITFRGNYCSAMNNVIKNTYACGIVFESTVKPTGTSFGLADGNIITGNNNTNGDYAGTAHGIHCEPLYSHNITIVNNHIYDLNSTAYLTSESHYSRAILVHNDSICNNNIIENIEDMGILTAASDNITINNNIIRKINNFGIRLWNAHNIIVTGNHIIDSSKDIAEGGTCKNNIILSNNII